MDKNQMNAALMEAQTKAQAEVMRAQYQHEEDQALAKVRHLSSQVAGRVRALSLLADDVARAVDYSDDFETFRYGNGAFGSDTDTIDTLLAALGVAVENLATIRARRASVETTAATAAEQMVAMFERADASQPAQQEAMAMPAPGQYL